MAWPGGGEVGEERWATRGGAAGEMGGLKRGRGWTPTRTGARGLRFAASRPRPRTHARWVGAGPLAMAVRKASAVNGVAALGHGAPPAGPHHPRLFLDRGS